MKFKKRGGDTMNSLEDLHANRMMTVYLGFLDDLEILCALNARQVSGTTPPAIGSNTSSPSCVN